MRLKNKTILVTGSTNGIGAAIASQAVREGANVMIHGLEQSVAEQLSSLLGGQTRYTIADLSNTSNCKQLIDATVESFGSIDGIVNNAGIYPRNTIDNLTEALFDQVITVNLKAPLLLSQLAVQQFRKQKTKGSIVNIGSINAHCGQPDLLVYSISKGGLMTMTRNLSDALGSEGIRVNQLNVGWTVTENEIKTKIKDGLPPDWQAKVPPLYAPSGQLFKPEQVAQHACFWLSDESAPCSGSVYEVEQYPLIGRSRLSDLVLD